MQNQIELRIVEDIFKPALLNYTLPPEQIPFTALPRQVFERLNARNAAGDFNAFPISILWKDQVVGMFVLDKGEDLQLWTDNPNAFFLRSLSINPDYQQKGIAKQAMLLLPHFIGTHFASFGIGEIVLGVNMNNTIAKRLYSQIGFRELGFNMNPPFVGQIIMKWNF